MVTEKIKGIQVRFKQAEQTRMFLSKNKILRTDLRIIRDKQFVYFPIKTIPKTLFKTKVTIVEKEFEKQKTKPKTYRDILKLPKQIQDELPTSYDIIGDIILIKLPKNLQKYKKNIGESLLITNKNIKVVCAIEAVTGELRTRNLEIIAGEQRTTTTHKEYGVLFDVDVQKTYFSPRLATERKHIASLVKPKETIVDMFAGVAPFSIMIATYAHPAIIYALDKNKEAIRYAKQNIRKNKLLDKIEAISMDAKDAPRIFKKMNIQADRIIMTLPFSAHLFFSQALQIAADTCNIHYYDILKEEKIHERLKDLEQIAKKNKATITFLEKRKIKTYAPREFYIGIDIQATKKTCRCSSARLSG